MSKTAMAVAVAALVALGVAVALGTADPNALAPVAAASLTNDQMAYRVFAVPPGDGGAAVPVWLADDGGLMRLDVFPCAKRPAAVPPTALGCMIRIPLGDGGTTIGDYGADNVAQPGFWFGTGCVRTPCAIMSGDPSP